MEGDAVQAATTPDETTTVTADASAEVVDPGATSADGAAVAADTSAPAGTESTAEAAAPTAEDDADLAQYPEEVRASLKDLPQAERKKWYELYEQAGKHVEERLRQQKERQDRIDADNKAREARTKEIRDRYGRFIGAEAQTIENADGTTRNLPSYDELVKLSQTRAGRDRLYSEFGLDEDATEMQRAEWDARYDMIDAVRDDLKNGIRFDFDKGVREALKARGIDPNDILPGATDPADYTAKLLDHQAQKHQAEIKALTTKHADEIKLHTVNAEGLRARALAGDAPPIPTGGRTAGGEHIFTRSELAAMSSDEYRRNRETIDRQAAAGLIR